MGFTENERKQIVEIASKLYPYDPILLGEAIARMRPSVLNHLEINVSSLTTDAECDAQGER
jgi:hypothetical protein